MKSEKFSTGVEDATNSLDEALQKLRNAGNVVLPRRKVLHFGSFAGIGTLISVGVQGCSGKEKDKLRNRYDEKEEKTRNGQ